MYHNNRIFCQAPFTSQVMWADSSVSMCCNDKHKEYLDLEDEWESPSRKEAQQQFLNGEVPERCTRCLEKLAIKDNTLLKWYDRVFSDMTVEKLVKLEVPEYLHLSPHNKCNLACRMCTSVNSSTYGRKTDTEVCHESDVTAYVRKCLPTLRQYVFHGGDPVYHESFLEIVNILSERADDIAITVITNGTNLRSNGQDIVPYIKKFKNVKFMFSIDSVSEVNDFMRTFTKTNTVIENFNRICREIPHAEMAIHTVTTNISAMYFTEFCDFIVSDKLERLDGFSHFMLDNPTQFVVHNLPTNIRDRLTQQYNKYMSSNKLDKGNFLHRRLLNVMNNVLLSFDENEFVIDNWVTFMRFNAEFTAKVKPRDKLVLKNLL